MRQVWICGISKENDAVPHDRDGKRNIPGTRTARRCLAEARFHSLSSGAEKVKLPLSRISSAALLSSTLLPYCFGMKV